MITKQKGTYDVVGMDAKKRKYVCDVIDAICEKYNYTYIETPIFESSELFHRSVGESSDIVTKETYDFVDRGERNITLRPEGTAGVVRSFIENKMYGNLSEPVKVYYNGPMFRYERPQSGRNRQFTQFGIEVIGTDDVMSDAEVISLAYNTYKLLGIDVKVQLNSLGDNESRDNYRKALMEYFKPNIDSLCEDCKVRLEKNPLRILDCKVDANSDILKNAPKTIDYLNEDSLNRFNKLQEYLDLMEIDYEVNTNLVRGLDYYNHTVFEIVADIPDFGSQSVLGGGGRYNGLIEQLDGPSTPAIGFAMGLDRTILAMESLDVKFKVRENIDIFIMYGNLDEKETACYLIQDLRMNGFVCETDYMGKSFKNQFKSADRFNSKFLVILNSDDIKNYKVKVKDNETKEEELVSINDLVDYLDMKL
ncbi:MAG: histidine--tRNA ligase [Bacilli bacterium]|nr:histidine--tRNA ligase [Bacilli bacterium]